MAVDYTGVVNERLQAVKTTYYGMVSILNDLGLPAFLSQFLAGMTAVIVAAGSILYVIVLLSFVSVGTTLVKFALDVLKSVRQDGAADFAEVTGEAMSEFMAVDTSDVDFAVGKDAAASQKRAEQLGALFVDMMQGQFGKGGPQSPDQGEAAAKALAGYGINFATSNTFLSWMVELGTDGKFGDFDKLGEEIAKTIGLGRLTRQALRPLVRNAISQPYDRKMRALYRADLLGTGELARAAWAARLPGDTARTLLTQHGLSDDQIAELIEQHKIRLSAEEWDVLTSIGAVPSTRDSLKEVGDGAEQEVIDARLKVLTWKRLNHLRNHVLTEVLSQINQGFLQPLDLEKWLSELNIPSDEADLWRKAAGVAGERTRKRLSLGEMIFLFESAQITQADVFTWLQAEGYSPNDQQMMVLYFELKAAAAAHTKTGGAAAKTAHLHKEHVAYVTDEITGVFGRKPTTAELNYWVGLLDLGERTKHDFTTELKGLPTDGSAIPPG